MLLRSKIFEVFSGQKEIENKMQPRGNALIFSRIYLKLEGWIL